MQRVFYYYLNGFGFLLLISGYIFNLNILTYLGIFVIAISLMIALAKCFVAFHKGNQKQGRIILFEIIVDVLFSLIWI